ncbi:MAG: hypothetical protein M1814_001884 [Vezdaea aestivalis]|nr:MAG: hypothetical protein M1814_001884 [Vezdaea aestivalis]
MLRRPPTQIALSTEDITAYVEARDQRRAAAAAEAAAASSQTPNGGQSDATTPLQQKQGNAGKSVDPNDELRPLPGEKPRIVRAAPSRNERIGIGRR